jgi:single-strand DNA-binding protein
MSGVNKLILVGRLGKDPEIKTFGDKKKASFSIATSESYKNKEGEKVEDTQWHNVVAWGKTADLVEKYLGKGQQVYLEGKLVHRSYDNDKGEKKFVSEMNLETVTFLESKAA